MAAQDEVDVCESWEDMDEIGVSFISENLFRTFVSVDPCMVQCVIMWVIVSVGPKDRADVQCAVCDKSKRLQALQGYERNCGRERVYWVPVRDARASYSYSEAPQLASERAAQRREPSAAGQNLGTKAKRVRGSSTADTRRSAEPWRRYWWQVSVTSLFRLCQTRITTTVLQLPKLIS